MRVVLISGKARHGKTSTAEILGKHMKLAGHRALLVNNADYVKFVCAKYYGWDGKKDEMGRHLLQYVGTDVFRARDENFWVDTIIRLSRIIEADCDFLLVADWRFPNEYTRWAENGVNKTTRVRVLRPGFDNGLTEKQKNHASETSLDNFPMDYILSAVDLNGLETECKKILDKLTISDNFY